ncbi:MAG: HDOD domain-containing protein [Candidatus Gastranaerophilales bacterium]|nr:HDOD domain-containing protein [Candidatus Gastranaerophilales bacterium]
MKTVGYINSYRLQEIERSLEIRIQKEKVQEFCVKHGFELLKMYEEPEESRPDYKPELIKLINDASKREFEQVIILKFDRFGHDDTMRTWVMGELKKYKVETYSLTESKIQLEKVPTAISRAERIRAKVRDIPSLPEIVTKVMEIVQDPRSSASQLSRVIFHDPGLTTRVLRLVNSAYYGFPRQISSIQQAVTILGFTTMRGLVLSSSIFKIFSPKNDLIKTLDYKKFWKHSLVSAISAKKINNYLQFNEEDDIFSAAILHDIGKVILDQYDHENYTLVLQKVSNPLVGHELLAAEEEYCEISHQNMGYMVAEGWNLPESLSEVIRHHHDPMNSIKNKKLASIVNVGNILSHIALDLNSFDAKLFNKEVLDYLGINEDDLLVINSQIIEEIENIGDLESFFK